MKYEEMNDIDFSKWKKYDNITEKGLWISKNITFDKFFIPSREEFNNFPSKQLSSQYHGIFIPEIPYQMILRYTKKGETVWDPFAGTGTTIDVARLLERKYIANDIHPLRDDIQKGDSRTFNPGKKVQLIIAHPPYANIVKYSDDSSDLSILSWKDFLKEWDQVVDNIIDFLENERFFILVCGDLYNKGEYIPLGYRAAEIIANKNFKYKGHIIKDFGETKGGWKQRASLERYRALKGGYWKFAGDNIFILQKRAK